MKKQITDYILVSIISLLIIFIIYIINGVYPFGKHTIINGDFGRAYVPLYYYMHDVFNGKESLFYTSKLGMGSNMYDLTCIYGIFSPVNWLLFFTKRSNIPFFLSYLLIIRICLLSITSLFLYNKLFPKVESFWKILFSLLYAFSGYIIVYHTNFVWLDNIILFPLLIYGLNRIFDDKGFYFYIFIMFFSLIFSYYISYMEVLFVLFFSFGYIFIFDKNCDKKRIIFNLGIGTLFAFGLSSFCLIPVLKQTFMSFRFSSHVIFLKNSLIGPINDKILILLFYGLPVILYFILLKSKNTKKDVKRFYLYLFLIFCGGVFIEPINLMWHTGNYLCFPFRYGFIVVMILYLGSLRYLSSNPKLVFKSLNYYFTIFVLLLFFGIVLYKCIPLNVASNPSFHISNGLVLMYLVAVLFSGIIIIYFILNINSFKIKMIFLCSFLFIYCIGMGVSYIGISTKKHKYETTDKIVLEAGDRIVSYDKDYMLRYKNLNNDLFENSSLINNMSSISTWKMIDKDSVISTRKLGYYNDDWSVTEVGGTLFSDVILGTSKYISDNKLSNDVFDYINDNTYKLKNNNDSFALVYNNYVSNFKEDDVIDYQNTIYKKMFGNKEDIFDSVLFDVDDVVLDNNDICYKNYKELSFNIKIDDLSELYFYFDNYSPRIDVYNDVIFNKVKVNGELLYFPDENNGKNTKSYGINKVIDLGTFENKEVNIKLYLKKNICVKNFKFVSLKIDKLNSFIDDTKPDNISFLRNNNNIKINVLNSSGNKYLFLPINYLNGYNIVNNGKSVRLLKTLGNFVSIPLKRGNNKIILTYYPPYFKISCIISIIFLILFFLSFCFQKKKFPSFIYSLSLYLYYFVFVAIFIYIYIYSFFKFIF